MDQQEFDQWQAVTASSIHRWIEDGITRYNGNGALYYTGGEDGQYMAISPEGTLTSGTYEGAYPHIGEAIFTIKLERDCGSFNEAFQLACRLGGVKFLLDIFSFNRFSPQDCGL